MAVATLVGSPVNTYTVGHANAHNTWRAAKVLASYGCDSFGLNEANRLTARLIRLRGYRPPIYDPGARDQRRGSRANVVLVRERHKSHGTLLLQASDAVAPTRWAPDRWITGAMLATPVGRLCHLSIHANAVVAGRGLDVPRVREYDEMMRTLDRVLRLVEDEGYVPVVSGDFNVRAGDADEQKFLTPYALFERHRMSVRTRGIDGIAYGRGLAPIGKGLRVLSRKQIGSDHPGLVLSLARARAGRRG